MPGTFTKLLYHVVFSTKNRRPMITPKLEPALYACELNGRILRELVTLVNPERDMGPTRIHGLSTEDVFDAPRFNEVAPQLLELLDGCVAIAGHNVRFDQSFLAVEFDRVGCPLPEIRTLCTMQLAGGGSLSCVCAEYGIAFEGDAHSAWNDALATANLLRVLLKDAPNNESCNLNDTVDSDMG